MSYSIRGKISIKEARGHVEWREEKWESDSRGLRKKEMLFFFFFFLRGDVKDDYYYR